MKKTIDDATSTEWCEADKANRAASVEVAAIARAEKAEAALAFIAENGGTTHETECGPIACNGSWCAEQARAALDFNPVAAASTRDCAIARAEKAEAECLEQARLLGKSGEREADLLGKLERLAKDKARLDWLDMNRRLEHGNCDRSSRSWYLLIVPTGYDYYKGGVDLPLRAAIDAAMKASEV